MCRDSEAKTLWLTPAVCSSLSIMLTISPAANLALNKVIIIIIIIVDFFTLGEWLRFVLT